MTVGDFQVHNVSKPADVAGFGRWLVERARAGSGIGLAVRDRSKKLAFSTLDDCFILDLKNNPLGAAAFRTAIDQQQLDLMTRNAVVDLPELSRMLAPMWDLNAMEVYRKIEPLVSCDMTAAASVINQSVTRPGKFRQLEHNAYEIALVVPQYEMGIAPYYERVALPLAKLTAEQALAPKVNPQWWVTYNNLWLKVLAYYSGDPTLRWMFFNDRQPFEALGKLLGVTDREAELMMLWEACGRDMDTVTVRFPSTIREMGDGPKEWGRTVDRALPALSSACLSMKRSYFEQNNITTLFKRRLRPGGLSGEGVAFRVFATVEELVSIAAVTFWQNRPSRDILIRRAEGGPAEETIRVIGSGPKEGRHAWLNEIRQLATLATPLGAELGLNPIVTEAP